MNRKDLDRILTSLTEVLGSFSQSSVIGGGIALLLYRHYLVSAQSTDYPEPAATIDFYMPVPRELPQTQDSLGSRLTQAGFVRETQSLETPPVESNIEAIAGQDITIEFLTYRCSRENSDQNVNLVGISAKPLFFFEMSREFPRSITTISGAILHVVAPAPWMFHKALTFPRRHSKAKRA